MELSRKARKQELARAWRMRVISGTVILLLGALLALFWHWRNFPALALASATIIFTVVGANPRQVRRYIPGLNSEKRLSRCVARLLYLTVAIAIVSWAGLISYRNM